MADILASLSEASYGGITFPVEAAPLEGGNDFAEHTAYRRPGADQEFTGRKPYTGSFTIPLLNIPALEKTYGTLFPDLLLRLVSAFEETPTGPMVHPLLGAFEAAITGWTHELDASVRNGVKMTVRWAEQNGTAYFLAPQTGTPDTVSSDTVSDLADKADEAGVGVTGYVPISGTVDTALDVIDETTQPFSTTVEMFRAMVEAVTFNQGLTAVQDPAGWPCARALQNALNAINGLRAAAGISDTGERVYTVPAPMALFEVAIAVYGDASQTTAILSANAINDPMSIPAGTRLTILSLPSTTGVQGGVLAAAGGVGVRAPIG
jgi:prophage DNA circulation protein